MLTCQLLMGWYETPAEAVIASNLVILYVTRMPNAQHACSDAETFSKATSRLPC